MTLHGAPLIYVHAKVSIFDDTLAMVSSANQNGRSLRWDTEAGVEISDQDRVRDLQRMCLAHWMNGAQPPWISDILHIAGELREIAQANVLRPAEERDGFLLPFPFRRARIFGRNLPGVPHEMT